jgi:hypothetical protein
MLSKHLNIRRYSSSITGSQDQIDRSGQPVRFNLIPQTYNQTAQKLINAKPNTQHKHILNSSNHKISTSKQHHRKLERQSFDFAKPNNRSRIATEKIAVTRLVTPSDSPALSILATRPIESSPMPLFQKEILFN